MKIIGSGEPKQFTSEHSFDGFHAEMAYGLIEVYGPDAQRFLHAQTTSDVASLEPLHGQLSALLDRKAHIKGYFSLYRKHDSYRILASRLQIDDILEHLEQFRFADKVEFLNLHESGKFIGLFGLHSRKLLMNMVTKPRGVNLFEHDLIDASLFDRSVHIFRLPLSTEEVFFIWATNDEYPQVLEKLRSAAGALNLRELSKEELTEARIEAGIPLFGVDFDSENLIVELGLEDRSVSYTKGCFQGQEVLARVKAHGTPAKQLTGLTFGENSKESFPMGSKLMVGSQEAAVIYSNCFCRRTNRVLALAFVKKEFRAAGTVIKGTIGEAEAEATVTILPFIEPQDTHARAVTLYEKALGIFAKGTGDPISAVELLKEAIVLDPAFEDAYEALGVILSKHEQIDEAIEWMERLARLNPDSVMAHANLSVFYLEKGDKEKAEEEKAVSMSIRMKLAARDAVKQKKDKEDEAKIEAEAKERMKMFAEVLEIDPEDLLANYGLGSCHNQLKEFDKAVGYLEKALSIKATHTVAYLELGKAFDALGEKEKAAQAFEKGIEVASQKGDMTPLKEMQACMAELKDRV